MTDRTSKNQTHYEFRDGFIRANANGECVIIEANDAETGDDAEVCLDMKEALALRNWLSVVLGDCETKANPAPPALLEETRQTLLNITSRLLPGSTGVTVRFARCDIERMEELCRRVVETSLYTCRICGGAVDLSNPVKPDVKIGAGAPLKATAVGGWLCECGVFNQAHSLPCTECGRPAQKSNPDSSASTGDHATPSREPSQSSVECPKCRTQLAFNGDECGLCKENDNAPINS